MIARNGFFPGFFLDESSSALRAATLLGAEISGLDRDLGMIEIGKLADLVILT